MNANCEIRGELAFAKVSLNVTQRPFLIKGHSENQVRIVLNRLSVQIENRSFR